MKKRTFIAATSVVIVVALLACVLIGCVDPTKQEVEVKDAFESIDIDYLQELPGGGLDRYTTTEKDISISEITSDTTIIRHRTQEKEMQLAGNLAMTKNDWLEKGGIYHGTLWEAKQQNYYTIRVCEKMGQPVSAEELQQAKDFAMCKSYYAVLYNFQKRGS